MQIVKTPAKILISKARPVKKFDKKLARLVEKMIKTLKAARNPEGVGLAAPQVGVLKRLFVMQVNADKKGKKPRYEPFINPEIIARARIKKLPNSPNIPNSRKSSNLEPPTSNHAAESSILEGCLSIKNVWGFPQRSPWVKLRYQDLSGKKCTQKFTASPAVIVQHEIDHLNGVLFTHKVLKQKDKLYRIKKDEATNEPTLVPLDV